MARTQRSSRAFITAALEGRAPVIYGDGEQSRDFIYVGNVVDVNLLAATLPAAAGRILNVGMGQGVSLNTLVAALGRTLGRELVPDYQPERPGDIRDERSRHLTVARSACIRAGNIVRRRPGAHRRRLSGLHTRCQRRCWRASVAMTVRILYVADSLMAGGIESQLVELVTHLDRAQFAPSVLSLYGPTARALHYAPALRAAGIPLYLPDLGWTVVDKLRGVAAVVRVARTLRPEIIQAEGYHANLLTRLAWPLLPRSTRLLGTLRGVHSARQMRYERLSAWMCARIVANAPHLKMDLAQRGHVPLRQIVYIPNGIAATWFAQPHDPRCGSASRPEHGASS